VGEEMALQMALGAGGDFELAFTLRPSGLQAAREACSLTVIGEVVEEGIWMEREGERREIVGKGYEHRIGIQGNQLQS